TATPSSIVTSGSPASLPCWSGPESHQSRCQRTNGSARRLGFGMAPEEVGNGTLGRLAGCRCEHEINKFLVIRHHFDSVDLEEDQCRLQADAFVAVDERMIRDDVKG